MVSVWAAEARIKQGSPTGAGCGSKASSLPLLQQVVSLPCLPRWARQPCLVGQPHVCVLQSWGTMRGRIRPPKTSRTSWCQHLKGLAMWPFEIRARVTEYKYGLSGKNRLLSGVRAPCLSNEQCRGRHQASSFALPCFPLTRIRRATGGVRVSTARDPAWAGVDFDLPTLPHHAS